MNGLWLLPIQEDRVLVTEDKDFGELIFVRKLPHGPIVRLVGVWIDEQVRGMGELLTRRAHWIWAVRRLSPSRAAAYESAASGGFEPAVFDPLPIGRRVATIEFSTGDATMGIHISLRRKIRRWDLTQQSDARTESRLAK